MLILGGILILAVTVGAVLSKKVPVFAAYALIPPFIALLFGAEPAQVVRSAAGGITPFLNTVCMILLSVCFFCGLAETGMFDRILFLLLRGRQLTPSKLLFLTISASAVVMVSGSITSGYLVILPAFLPLYRSAGLDRRILLTLVSAVTGTGLMLPWSSKVLLIAGITGLSPAGIWRAALPLQAAGLALCFCLGGYYILRLRGKMDLKRALPPSALTFPERPYARPDRLAVNCLLFLACVVLMILKLPAIWVLVGMLALLMMINYPDLKTQDAIIRRTGGSMFPLCIVILSVGIMLGVLDGSGMTDAMAYGLTSLIPGELLSYAPVLAMALATPLLILVHYHCFYALIPLLIALMPGVEALAIVLPFLVLYPTCCSPMTGLTIMACGICGEEPVKFAKFASLPLCAISYLSLLTGTLAGLFC